METPHHHKHTVTTSKTQRSVTNDNGSEWKAIYSLTVGEVKAALLEVNVRLYGILLTSNERNIVN
eukprot:2119129-Amphidinium_carterae.1